jgi:hypothetical protein
MLSGAFGIFIVLVAGFGAKVSPLQQNGTELEVELCIGGGSKIDVLIRYVSSSSVGSRICASSKLPVSSLELRYK